MTGSPWHRFTEQHDYGAHPPGWCPPVWSSARSPAERFRERSASQQRSTTIALIDNSFENELATLAKLGLAHVAQVLQDRFGGEHAVKSEPGALFPIGDTLKVSMSVFDRIKMDRESIIRLVQEQHQKGDLGLNGSIVSDVELSEHDVWIPELFGPRIESVAAVSRSPQNGLVRSIYQHGDKTVSCWTLLSPGRPAQTFVFSSWDPN
jgi:hypothetical protein